MRNRHSQTIAGRFFPFPKTGAVPIKTTECIYGFLDGDRSTFKVDTHQDRAAESYDTVVVFFHGLGGSSESVYNRRMSPKILNLGAAVVRVNHRGCDRSANYNAKTIYHAGSMADVVSSLDEIYKQFSHAKIILLGFSLSGNILLNLFADDKAAKNAPWYPNICLIVTVCPPMDLEKSSKKIASKTSRIYDRYFVHLLSRKVNAGFYGDKKRVKRSMRFTLRDFDQAYTAPKAGFESRDHYYSVASPHDKLLKIEKPTLILGSKDDPVVDTSIYDHIDLGEFVTLMLCHSGGHLGFISHKKGEFGDRFWMDEQICNVVRLVISEASEHQSNKT